MNRKIQVFSLAFILLFGCFVSNAQDIKNDLLKRRQALLDEINNNQKMLNEIRNNKQNSLLQLKIIQDKLAARQKLVHNIQNELGIINNGISKSSEDIHELEKKMDILKTQYAKMIRYAYLHRTSIDLLTFVFSAKNYNEAFQKITYLKKYRQVRDQQLDKINNLKSVLDNKITTFELQKKAKEMVMVSEISQNQTIEAEKLEQQKVVNAIKLKESDVNANIAKSKADAQKLQRQIENIIAKEIKEKAAREKAENERLAKENAAKEKERLDALRIAKQKAEEEKRRIEEERKRKEQEIALAKKTEEERARKEALELKKSQDEEARKERARQFAESKRLADEERARKEQELASLKKQEVIATNNITKVEKETATSPYTERKDIGYNFDAYRGSLSMPLNGRIVGRFGTQPHPVFPNLKIENNGIDIYGSVGQMINCVFDGVVSSIFATPGGKGSTILVSHGDYYTVYTNVVASVSKGSSVKKGQALGRLSVNDDGEPIMNFQVWRSKGGSPIKLNPSDWVR